MHYGCKDVIVTNVWKQKFPLFPFNITDGNESSREQRFLGTKVPPMKLSFLGTKALGCESCSYIGFYIMPYKSRHIGSTASFIGLTR